MSDEYKQNIAVIKNMSEYLRRASISFRTIHATFTQFIDDLYELLTTLNFRQITPQLLDSYNKLIMFLYDRIKGILSTTFIDGDSKDILIIKPVRSKSLYHELEITYFTDDLVITKPIGSVSTVSIQRINDEIALLYTDKIFTFVMFDIGDRLTIEYLREHVTTMIATVKDIVQWINADVKSMASHGRSLVTIIEQLASVGKTKVREKYAKDWIEIVVTLKEWLE